MKIVMKRFLCSILGTAIILTSIQTTSLAEDVNDNAVVGESDIVVDGAQTELLEGPPVEETILTEAEVELFNRETELWGMDENGNIFPLEDGPALVQESPLMARSISTAKVVNFRTRGDAVTNYTEDGTGIAGYTNGAYGADAAYLGTSNGRVKFMQSGVTGWVRESDVQVIDARSANSISHYIPSNGRLLHKIATNMTSTVYGSSLDQGPAPSYLQSEVKYYSYDGHYFYTEGNYARMLQDYNENHRNNAVNRNNPYYNYFQYLPFRSLTNYSSSQLNTIINARTATASKMRNMGPNFVNRQNQYGVNALLATGIAANESAWGNSNIAQTKNNLFGMNAVDSSPGQSANYYPNPDTAIKDFMETHMSKQYLSPTNWKYAGAFLGNKASGINVRYASDPYWGEKAANVAWTIDRQNSNRDAYKYTIGIKDQMSHLHTTLNVRQSAAVGSSVLYTTRGQNSHSPAQHAFIILGESNSFYKVQSDPVLNSTRTAINTGSGVYNFTNMYGFASKDFISVVSEGVIGAIVEPPIPVPSSLNNALEYSSHVQSIGWQDAVNNGEQSGTMDQGLSIEAMKIATKGISNLGIEYSAHVQNIGWQPYVANGAVIGTQGQNLQVEAMRIRLTGSAATNYRLYYRVHAQNFGWLGWAESGDAAGSEGYAYRIEAIQIVLLPRGNAAPGKVGDAYQTKRANIAYSSHVKNIGWQGNKYSGERSGTEGQALQMEGIRIALANQPYAGGVQYRTHVKNIGWQSAFANGAAAGTVGKNLAVEAIEISLTGTMAQYYDIYYRVHAQNFGWLGWARNGAVAGSEGYAYRMEAIQIQLVKKGEAAPTTGVSYRINPSNITYDSHVQNIGWQTPVFNAEMSGTTGRNLRVEALRIALRQQPHAGGVKYDVHVRNKGWQNNFANGAVAGTVGQRLAVEAIRVSLTGTMAQHYDIYYRVHAQNHGWLGWARNGQAAGTQGYANHIEAYEVRLVAKGGPAPGSTTRPFVAR